MENHIELAINKCINHQIPFVAYQKESDNNIYFYSNPTPNFQQKNTDFFSIVEFNSSSHKQVLSTKGHKYTRAHLQPATG